jgi:ribosomal protein S18 acetylase RimI-like enzyme
VIITVDWPSVSFENIVALYESVGWKTYTKDPSGLSRAFHNSSYVLICLDGDEVVAALRSISDDISIHYLQDVLVKPSHQRKGIGRRLVEQALKRHSHVRTHVLLTDDEETQKKFYQSLGYENLREFKDGSLNSFILINNS